MTETQPAPKLIALLDLTTAPDDRPTAISHLDIAGPIVRAMPGCIDFRVYPSIANATDVTVVHEWADEPAFRGYLESATFARSGAALRPLMTSAPVSRRFRVELIDVVD